MKKKNKQPLVLIIENEQLWQETLKELLEPLKAHLKIASTLMEGVKITEQYPPDSENPISLVILDMRIPIKKGEKVDLTGGIKFLKQYCCVAQNVPIIVFTAYEAYDNCVEAMKSGAYYYMPKTDPESGKYNAEKLLKMCRELLSLQEKLNVKEHELPDINWFQSHQQEVRKLFSGKYVLFVPEEFITIKDEPGVSCKIIDGVKLIVANSYSRLRMYVLKSTELRKLLPLIVFIEGEQQ